VTSDHSQASGREWKLGAKGERSASLEQSKKLDSNVITPGTEFMVLLSSALRYYVHLRINRDAGWREIKVKLTSVSAWSFTLLCFPPKSVTT
jgi:5'-3' exonuclease